MKELLILVTSKTSKNVGFHERIGKEPIVIWDFFLLFQKYNYNHKCILELNI